MLATTEVLGDYHGAMAMGLYFVTAATTDGHCLN